MSPDNPYVLKSYRYLRLVMVGLVVLLAASVLIELQQTGFGCWRTSISSYYWTPVRGVFVGALVAIGTCLIVLKGQHAGRGRAAQRRGALAPIVAFVPILDPKECQSTPWRPPPTVGEHLQQCRAFLLAGLVAVAVAWWVARREGRGWLSRADLIGLLVTIALVLAGIALFLWAREFFDRWAHYLAAIPLFLVLVAVMVVNAVSYARTEAAHKGREMGRAELANRYLAIAALTVALVVTLGLVTWLGHWRHGTFWLEVVVIAAFAVFWAVQTAELWGGRGTAPRPEGVLAPQSKAGEVGTQ